MGQIFEAEYPTGTPAPSEFHLLQYFACRLDLDVLCKLSAVKDSSSAEVTLEKLHVAQ